MEAQPTTATAAAVAAADLKQIGAAHGNIEPTRSADKQTLDVGSDAEDTPQRSTP
jgi:hypothetical protein